MSATRRIVAAAASVLLLATASAVPAQARTTTGTTGTTRTPIVGTTGGATPQVSVCDLIPFWPGCSKSRKTRSV